MPYCGSGSDLQQDPLLQVLVGSVQQLFGPQHSVPHQVLRATPAETESDVGSFLIQVSLNLQAGVLPHSMTDPLPCFTAGPIPFSPNNGDHSDGDVRHRFRSDFGCSAVQLKQL